MDYNQDYSNNVWFDSVWYYLSKPVRRSYAARAAVEGVATDADDAPRSGEVILDCEDFN